MTKLEKLKSVQRYYPHATIELNSKSIFQMLVAVMLSAQSTDKSVNIVTEDLFTKYPTPEKMAKASIVDLYQCISKIGLAKTKSRNLKALAMKIYHDYDSKVPNKKSELLTLPGVGTKTANVILANAFGQPHMAVDTHVWRISKRLAIVPENKDEKYTEETLERILKNEDINQFHHSLIFFGRYLCKARNPECIRCSLQKECRWFRINRK